MLSYVCIKDKWWINVIEAGEGLSCASNTKDYLNAIILGAYKWEKRMRKKNAKN